MTHLHLILIVAAFVISGIAACLPQLDRIRLVAAALALFFLSMLTGCASVRGYAQQHPAVVLSSEQIAKVALTAAASAYGGPGAGALAGAGLNALGTLLQAYLNQPVPASIITATPGVANVGQAMLGVVDTHKPVTQADVNKVFAAAEIANSIGTP